VKMRFLADRRGQLAALLAFALAALAIVPAFAQQNDQAIKIQTELVTIDVVVTDKDGNFVRNLKPEDFKIYEDDAPQKIDFFEANEQTTMTRPLAVVFALDISGSIKPEEVMKQREAAESFMKLMRPESVYSILAFNNMIRVVQDFTSEPRKVSEAFHKIDHPGGSTRLFASLDKGVSMLKRAPRFRSGRRLRRVIIVITDGIDSVDPVDQRDMIQRANDAEVTVYSITLPSYLPGLGPNRRAMTLLDVARIVPLTGGSDFSADTSDFTNIFKAIAEEIRSGYTLAYYPPDRTRHDGRIHQLRIESLRKGAIIRASRTNYLAGK